MARPPFDQFPPHYYHHWHHHHRRFGMFRRFFWFSFGGLASLAAVRHFGYSHFAVEGGHPTDRERNWDGGWQGCRRVMYAPHLERPVHPQYAPSSQNLQSSQERPASMPMPVPVQAVTGQTIPSLPPPPVGATVPPVEQRIETGIRDLGRRAEERVTDLSESTIDSMIASLVGLKSRLSEHRAEQQHQSQQQSQASQPPSPSQGRRV